MNEHLNDSFALRDLAKNLRDCLDELDSLAKANDSDYARPDPEVIFNTRSALVQYEPEVKRAIEKINGQRNP